MRPPPATAAKGRAEMNFSKSPYRNIIQIIVKGEGVHCLYVMRTTETHTGPYGPRPAYNLRTTALGTTLVAATFLAAILAVTYPAVAATVLVATVAAGATGRRLTHLWQARRRRRQSRRVCVPTTDVCVEA